MSSDVRPAQFDIDLGSDHWLTFADYKSDARTGANVYHLHPNGSLCQGWVAFAGGAWAASFPSGITTWKVVQADPLTLSPSLLCRACGDHGYIENGKWRRA